MYRSRWLRYNKVLPICAKEGDTLFGGITPLIFKHCSRLIELSKYLPERKPHLEAWWMLERLWKVLRVDISIAAANIWTPDLPSYILVILLILLPHTCLKIIQKPVLLKGNVSFVSEICDCKFRNSSMAIEISLEILCNGITCIVLCLTSFRGGNWVTDCKAYDVTGHWYNRGRELRANRSSSNDHGMRVKFNIFEECCSHLTKIPKLWLLWQLVIIKHWECGECEKMYTVMLHFKWVCIGFVHMKRKNVTKKRLIHEY